jgi:tetratricopeptide (TPR) repeat protein
MSGNWFQCKFQQWFGKAVAGEKRLQLQGALVKHYGVPLQDANALIARANKRATVGDIEGAFADLREAIRLNPTKATVFYTRGFLHNTLGNFESALDDFNRALALLPDYDEAYYQRGSSYFQLKSFSKALKDLSRAIQINPYSIKSYYKRAETYAELGDPASALADYAQAIARIPKDANAYYQRGKLLAKLGDRQAAITDFTTAITYNVRHADAYCSRGCCYADLGELEKAHQDFNAALLHDPTHQAAYYQRTYSPSLLSTVTPAQPTLSLRSNSPPTLQVPATLGSVGMAAELMEPSTPLHSIAEQPVSLAAYFERANQRAGNGDLEGAIADYTHILERDPHNLQAYFQRGQTYNLLGQEAAALSDLNQAIHWARMRSLGQLKHFSGTLSETIQTLKTALNKPTMSEVKLDCATGKTIEASIADYTRTLATQPSAAAYFNRAQSRALLGDLQGAIADYTETIRLDPNYPQAFYRRGLNRSALGDTSGATQDLNQAIRRQQRSSSSELLETSSLSFSTVLNPAATLPALLQTQMSPPPSDRTCNHRGNRPGSHFCIYCGETFVASPEAPRYPVA